MVNRIKTYFDRNWNLLFNKDMCVQIILDGCSINYNDVMLNYGGIHLRYLGENWFKTVNLKKINNG